MTAEERAAYEEGGFRFDPPAYGPVTLVELEAAIKILQSWTRRPSEIRAALAIPSAQALAPWRRDKTSIPWPTRERAAIVLALGHRLSGGVDFVTLKPLPDLKLRGRPPIPGRAVLAGGMLSELLALLLQLVLAEEAEEAAERRRKRRKGSRR